MNLDKKIDLLVELGTYLSTDSDSFQEARGRAYAQNRWFTDDFTLHAGMSIGRNMLSRESLQGLMGNYPELPITATPKTIGLVMAGNIPFVGIQDLLCIFLSGHFQRIKVSSKDGGLTQHVVDFLCRMEPEVAQWINVDDMLKGCDAYIATGSDNTARYFEQYFSKYPNIIRRNRTSVAILDGKETKEELDLLADDIQLYFGLGCRNVTQILVPKGYDFEPLLRSLDKYNHFRDHDKFRNNYDYQLTIALMNNRFYMSNDSIVLVEEPSPFSPISQLHYQYYDNPETAIGALDPEKIQCVVGHGHLSFGQAQQPGIGDFPDGVDVMEFLSRLINC